MNIMSSYTLIPFHTPNPDKKCRKWSGSWKNRRNKNGNRIKKPHQYNLVNMATA